MKVLMVSIGTRGDMEPFLAIGELLLEKGVRVVCAFPEQFRGLAEEAGLEFASLGTDYIELLESDLGKAALGAGGSWVEKLSANIGLARRQNPNHKALVRRQFEIVERENPDRILYNGLATYPLIWGLEHPGKHILICPMPYMHYVRDHTHIAFHRDLGPLLNRLTYSLADFGAVVTAQISARWLQLSGNISLRQLMSALQTRKAIYTISPALFARPEYWPDTLQVLGYHRRRPGLFWQPDKALGDFLAAHKGERLLFITFGSMTNPEPERITEIFCKILERNKIPALLNTAAGGLVEPENYDPERLHFVSQIPYDWILPRSYGVIHHGGSGTTHLALQHGCATLVIPQIIDQFVWDGLVEELGVGPRGIDIRKVTARGLEGKILDLVNTPSFKEQAEQVAARMGQEELREELCRTILSG